MVISGNSAKKVLTTVSDIRENFKLYYINANATIRSTNNLLTLCQQFLQKKITLQRHPDHHQNHKVKSFYVKNSDGGYDIVYLSDMNNCWMRFAICKELFHVILDEEGVCNTNLKEHVESFFATPTPTDQDPKLSPTSTQYEALAEFAAMEFLFPYSERKALKESSQPIDFEQIAQRYLVPRMYVEIYLSDFFMSNLGRIRSQI